MTFGIASSRSLEGTWGKHMTLDHILPRYADLLGVSRDTTLVVTNDHLP